MVDARHEPVATNEPGTGAPAPVEIDLTVLVAEEHRPAPNDASVEPRSTGGNPDTTPAHPRSTGGNPDTTPAHPRSTGGNPDTPPADGDSVE